MVKDASRHGSKHEQYRERTVKIHEGLGDVLELLGRHDEARASYQDALADVLEHDMVLKSQLHRKTGKTLEVQRRFKEALRNYELAEQTGDVVLQSRSLTYLTILYRKCGQVKKVRQYIPRCHTISISAQLIEYITLAKANLAWAAWREGNLAEAEANGRDALETWQKELVGHGSSALQWTALWPLLGVAHAQNKVSNALEFAHLLIEPTQLPPMPDALRAILEKAINSWKKGDKKVTHTILNQAIESAREIGYL